MARSVTQPNLSMSAASTSLATSVSELEDTMGGEDEGAEGAGNAM